MIDFKEIFEAWLIAHNPTKEQSELAEKRLSVCIECEFKKEILKKNKWSALCIRCGCPLNKKVFSTKYNACPAKKWASIDSESLSIIKDKDQKSII